MDDAGSFVLHPWHGADLWLQHLLQRVGVHLPKWVLSFQNETLNRWQQKDGCVEPQRMRLFLGAQGFRVLGQNRNGAFKLFRLYLFLCQHVCLLGHDWHRIWVHFN